MSARTLWPQFDLAWHLHYTGATLGPSRADILREIAAAFAEWSKAGVFRFVQATHPSESVDIHIRFDEAPTVRIRPGPRLGTSCYPWHTLYRGMIWLNPSVSWATDWWDLRGYYLRAVMVHQIGHTIGLPNSGQPGAMTEPYSRFRTRVTHYDITKLRALYCRDV